MRSKVARLSPPLSAQIVVLMLGVLVVAQMVTLFFTLLAPPAPAPQYRLQEVAAALRGDPAKARGDRPLVRSIRRDPPSLNSAGWLVSERSRRELAALLQTNEANVRLLFYSPLPFAGTDPGARAQLDGIQPGAGSGRAWPQVLGATPAAPGLTTVRYAFPVGGGPGSGPPPGGGPFGGGPPNGSFDGPPNGQAGAQPGGPAAGGGFPDRGGGHGAGAGVAGASGSGRTSVPFWQDPPTGTRIKPYFPPAPPAATASQAEPAVRAPASAAPPSGAAGDLAAGDAGRFSTSPNAGAGATTQTPGITGHAQARPDGFGQGGFGQGLGGGFGASGAGVQGGQGPQAGQFAGPGLFGGAGPVMGQGLGLPNLGAPLGGSIPSVGQPQSPPKETAALVRPAARIEAIAPRPLTLATEPRAQPIDLGLIAPAPMVAAQNNDVGGWIVGTPQEASRGLFGLAPSPFVQGDFVAAVRNASNQWVTVAPQPEPFPNAWQRRVIWWFVAAFAVVGPLGYLFARRLARPIDQFAAAAERLGREPTAPLAPLGGPAEIGRAAIAFNQMHSRLRRFVEDRTGMVGAISHDLRTPLARMRFRLERVPPDVRSAMLTDIQQMEEMISSVLVFIRDAAEPAVRERIDLRSLVECVVDDAALMGGDAVLDPGDPVSVEVDTLSVQRVLTNLIDNALKYGDRADVRLYHEGGDAVAEVTDAGPGLPPHEIERVFMPFYRADHARSMNQGGIGLGLAVSRSIARAHGGDVLLRSNGQGLTAQLRLPLASAPGIVKPLVNASAPVRKPLASQAA